MALEQQKNTERKGNEFYVIITPMDNKKDIIAFWGCPDKNLIRETKFLYKNAQWVDLDIDYGYADLKFLPDAYCVIIKNILNNALHLKNRIIKILAPIGKDKCDSAYFIAKILDAQGFEVVFVENEKICPDKNALKLPISKSNLPLKEKIELITKNIVEQKNYSHLKPQKPRFGFWGVPPNDLSILELFPNNTEVFGWVRAVEAGFPGDWEIEVEVDPELPTVFFTQAFCSKTAIAKHLATKYQGLFIDIDKTPNQSAKAKIEAFLKLR